MTIQSNVIAFPRGRFGHRATLRAYDDTGFAPLSFDEQPGCIVAIATRAPIAVVDNSADVARLESSASAKLRLATRAADFATAALLAGDAAAASAASARAESLGEDMIDDLCEAAHLERLNGVPAPTQRNWDDLTPMERFRIVDDHYDCLWDEREDTSMWYDLVVANTRRHAA